MIPIFSNDILNKIIEKQKDLPHRMLNCEIQYNSFGFLKTQLPAQKRNLPYKLIFGLLLWLCNKDPKHKFCYTLKIWIWTIEMLSNHYNQISRIPGSSFYIRDILGSGNSNTYPEDQNKLNSYDSGNYYPSYSTSNLPASMMPYPQLGYPAQSFRGKKQSEKIGFK